MPLCHLPKAPVAYPAALKVWAMVCFVDVQPLLAGADAAHAASRVVAPGQEFGAGGGADAANVEVLEQRAVAGQRIDIRRREIGVAVDAEVAPTLIVREDDHHVGAGGCGGRVSAAERQGNRREKKQSGYRCAAHGVCQFSNTGRPVRGVTKRRPAYCGRSGASQNNAWQAARRSKFAFSDAPPMRTAARLESGAGNTARWLWEIRRQAR